MAVNISISGRDYTKYDLVNMKITDPHHYFGESDNLRVIGDTVSKIFLDKLSRDEIKYKDFVEYDKRVSGATSRNPEKDFHLCEFEEKGYKFNNIVGVMTKRSFTITEEDLDRQMKTSYADEEAEISPFDEGEKELILQQKYNMKLQIGSRFDNERAFFLATMLLQNIPELNELEAPMSEDDIYNFLLVYSYRNQLLESYTQGPYRSYTQFEGNDSNLKGVIDIARHIKLNMGLDNGKIAYNYRENTADNHLNHLFLYAYEYIKKFYPDLSNTLLMGDIRVSKIINELYTLCHTFEYSNITRTMNKGRKIISHPFYHQYDKLRLTSMMILQHLGVSFFDGDGEEVQGILFYVPDLWEMYLERILLSNFTIEAQAERRVYGDLDGKNFKKKTYPDYIFVDKDNRNVNKQIMILDAKYRIGWGRRFKNKTFENLDDYTKCIRDMNTLNVNGTGVIFPVNKKENEPAKEAIKVEVDLDIIAYKDEYIMHKISLDNTYDTFYSFPIIIPDTSASLNYKAWSQKFGENIKNTLEKINEAYERERDKQSDVESIDALSYSKENFELLKRLIKDIKSINA